MSGLVKRFTSRFAVNNSLITVTSILALLMITSCTPQATPTANPTTRPIATSTEISTDAPTAPATDETDMTAEAMDATEAMDMTAEAMDATAEMDITAEAMNATEETDMTVEATDTAAAQTVIVLADISADNPAEVIEAFQPLADYLASNLADEGITEGIVRVAPDFETIASWLESGEVDLYFDSPYPAMIVSELSGGEPMLRRWKEGVSEYHSVVFTLADSDIEELSDLQGSIIAFDAPTSTSGYMLPLAYLVEAELTTTELSNTDAAVEADEIGYIFADGDDNAIQAVLSGRVGAAVVDSSSFADIPQETRDQLNILLETEPLPRHVVVIRPGIDAGLRARIQELLLAMEENEEGLAALDSFEETAQFDEFPGGVETALNRMRELYDLVQSQ